MAPAPPSSTLQVSNFSPAELSYLHTSLSYPKNPIRPDGRSATQFRTLTAETSIVPNANGSARIGFADGTQAIVGVKAEVEKTVFASTLEQSAAQEHEGEDEDKDSSGGKIKVSGSGSWVEMSIEIPGLRDDDPLPVFLAEMMREGLIQSGSGSLAETGGLKERLVINQGWHWRIYVDILLLSPPLSYPLPLLSLTTHLALLSTKLPRLISKDEEDPMFDDDWDAAECLYPRKTSKTPPTQHIFRPPISLLVISVGQNVIFDPSREEIAVADSVFCVSVARDENKQTSGPGGLRLLAIRTIDPPARMTHPGVPDAINAATIGLTTADTSNVSASTESEGVWTPRRGGVKREVVSRIAKLVLQPGGVGDEVMEGLEMVEVD
ncbi:exosome complex component [Trichophyton mentagrophytes]|nr:exosome complex component [Trichophyton mentagrophytes]